MIADYSLDLNPASTDANYNLQFYGYLAMSFIVFSVSLAIVRNMFNRMMAQLPDEKSIDWKKVIKEKCRINPKK